MRSPPDPGRHEVRVLQRPQGRGSGSQADLPGPQRGGRMGGPGDLRGQRARTALPGRGQDLHRLLGAIHSLPGLPADGATGHLSPTSWEVPPPPTVSRLRATSCARSPGTGVTSPPTRQRSSCRKLAICNIEDKRARQRQKEQQKGRAGKSATTGRLIEGAITTNWKQALQQLSLAYPDRINPHL